MSTHQSQQSSATLFAIPLASLAALSLHGQERAIAAKDFTFTQTVLGITHPLTLKELPLVTS